MAFLHFKKAVTCGKTGVASDAPSNLLEYQKKDGLPGIPRNPSRFEAIGGRGVRTAALFHVPQSRNGTVLPILFPKPQ